MEGGGEKGSKRGVVRVGRRWEGQVGEVEEVEEVVSGRGQGMSDREFKG